MSDEKKDRFQSVDKAVDRLREEFEETVEGSKSAGEKATKEVRETIDELEERVAKLRKREKEES